MVYLDRNVCRSICRAPLKSGWRGERKKMITIVEVNNNNERKRFLDFPYTLYKGNPCYTPPLYSDEKLIFSKKNVYFDTCESVFFNAYDGDKVEAETKFGACTKIDLGIAKYHFEIGANKKVFDL